jgi:hypothetical protein
MHFVFSDETSSVGFSGESFNSYTHSSRRNCPVTVGSLQRRVQKGASQYLGSLKRKGFEGTS